MWLVVPLIDELSCCWVTDFDVVPPIDELRCCWVTDFEVVLPGEWADGEISAFVVTLIFTEELGGVFDRTLVP